MSRLSRKHLVALAVLCGGVITVAAAVHFNQPRVLANRSYPDGTSRVVVGKPRLCGFMGIQIVLQNRAADGTVTFASVQDLFGAWVPAIRKYENKDGGGLLKPFAETDDPHLNTQRPPCH